jgi:type I restriction enzyme, S subunit
VGSKPLNELLITTKDGDWGDDSPQPGLVPYRVIRGADFPAVRIGDTSTIPVRYLNPESAGRRTLQPDDIIIETAGGNRDRPTGRTLLITNRLLTSSELPATCASFSRFLRVDPLKAEPVYVFWYLQYLYELGEMWEHQVQHTGVARFQYTRFAESIAVPLPPKSTQRAIAHILGTLDDKIELNRRMNETLEAMARAIFKSWFVDFDPVRAKAEGCQPTGMDAETAALFPDSFEDSRLGKIPNGWRVAQLNEIASMERETLNPDGFPGEIFDHYSIPSYDEGREPKSETGEAIKSNKFLVPAAAVLVSKLNPRFPRVWLPEIGSVRRSVCSTEFIVLIPKNIVTREHLYCLCVSESFFDTFATLVTGTSGSHQRVKPEDLLRMQVVVARSAVVTKFSDLVAPLLRQVSKNSWQSRTLTAIRDALLPKLISGDVCVKGADVSARVAL